MGIRWTRVTVLRQEEVQYRQARPGRPGPDTAYRRKRRFRFDLTWAPIQDALSYDLKTDGIFPLVSNDRRLSWRKILKAYKLGQPQVEQRHHHLKGVHEVAPQYLKSVSRIEAFLCVYFFALLVNALIEREVRRGMKRRGLKALPLYPERRPCKRPTTQHILRAFEGLMVHRVHGRRHKAYVYSPKLTRLQKQLLRLMGIPQAQFQFC